MATDYTTNFEKIKDVKALVPQSRAVITPAISIIIFGKKIGYIQSFNETQNRAASPQYEIGTEGIVEHTVGQPTYTIAVTKFAVYRNNLLKVFQEQGLQEKTQENSIVTAALTSLSINSAEMFQNLVHMPIPFDIEVQENDPASMNTAIPEDSSAITTTRYLDCIMTSYSRPINATGDLTIAETANLVCRDIKHTV